MSIRTERLTKHYGNKLAVSELDLQVEPGEILGFLGPNGAGKSTTVKVLAGLIRPDHGRASVCGFDVLTQPLEVKKRLGYVPETPALYESLTANEYLELVSCLHHLDPKTATTRRAELLELFGLVDNRDQRLSEFSKGMRQKIVLASALIHRPDALILDEPLDGLDANSAMIVKELLKKMAVQGKTIMFSSHILDVVERMCTRIVIINHGKFVTSGTSAEIRAREEAATLEDAFSKLTGVRDVGQVTSEFLASLDRV
jgi:ABC-2 type transport system ATP-binding protein